jgi:DNA modification methylase
VTWEVLTGRWQDVLPEGLRVDHVITDPPYEAEAHAGARRCPKPGARAGSYTIPFDSITEAERDSVAALCKRVASKWAIVFCQAEGVDRWKGVVVSNGLKWKRSGIWIKPDSSPQFNGDGWAQGFECMGAAWCGKGKSKWNAGGKRGVYTFCVNNYGRITSGRPHPTQKPLDLMLALVADFTDPNDLILDPYCGSGTTGVACLRLGRNFIGCEMNPTYAEIARERLRAEESNSTLQARQNGQLPMFGGGK